MRRSEMIEHIAQELIDVAIDERSYKTAYRGYFQRKAAEDGKYLTGRINLIYSTGT